jgi:hypothetical protein
MRVGNLLPARPNWYDRNPAERGFTANILAVAPHGSTSRFLYTVPAAKKFILEFAQTSIWRDTVAAPVGLWNAAVSTLGSTGAGAQTPIAISTSNVLLFRIDLALSYQAIFLPTGTVSLIDQDTSTGGTCSFISVCKGTEYDA